MVDLHSHSTASDGELSPTRLIALAKETGLSALALTDHDTTAGLEEASRAAETQNIRLIPGVEIEVGFKPGEFHLLGLGLKRYREGALANFLEDIRRRRIERNRQMLSLMQSDGIPITLGQLEEMAQGEIIGRVHMARCLIEMKQADNIPDAFNRLIGQGCPYYVPKNQPSLEKAISAIHAAGGKTVVAHPLSLWLSWGKLSRTLDEWKELGLDGVEALHSGNSGKTARRLTELAEKKGLFITGGSDFHGTGRPDRKLGYGSEGRPLPDSLLEPFNET